MLGRDAMLRLAEQALAATKGDDTEIVVRATNSALTRLANSVIHQNVADEDLVLSFRSIVGNAQGWAECNDSSSESIRAAADYAYLLARQDSAASPAAIILAGSQEYPEATTLADATCQFDAAARAEAAKTIAQVAADAGFEAAGAIQRSIVETCMVNSRGLSAYEATSEVDALCVISSEEGSGYARRIGRDVSTVDFAAMAEEAMHKCQLNEQAEALPPGRYTVLLEEYAVGDMVMALSAMGFSAEQVQQGASFLAGRFGEQLLDERVNIWDDALDAGGLPTRFDAEGVAKTRVDIIHEGAPAGMVHDQTTASKAGVTSTGHASALGPGSPRAQNLFMGNGERSKADLLAGIEQGLLISRFHYIALVHPGETRWSGMTRDGLFVVEDGEIVRAAKNMRFDDRITSSLSSLKGISQETRVCKGYFGSAVVPALLIADFNFTGVTQ